MNEHNPLELWGQVLINALPETQAKRVNLALKSARASKLPSPQETARGLHQKFSPKIVDEVLPKIDQVLSEVDEDLFLGPKVLNPEQFRNEAEKRWLQISAQNTTQDEAFLYWIQNWDKPKNPLNSARKLFGNAVRELNIGFRQSLLTLGTVLRRKALVDTFINWQLCDDITEVSSNVQNQKEAQLQSQSVLNRYGIDTLENNVLSHPDFYKRLLLSGGMNTTIYFLPRQILGWGTYFGLLNLPYFQEAVDTNINSINIACFGILAGTTITRMGIDYWVLKKRGYSPDMVETIPALMSGRVSETSQLKANPKWGFIGAPFDIAVSSFQPPYSAAWLASLPYSIPAYTLAIAVDQITFSATNLSFGVLGEIRDKNENKK